MRTRMQYGLTCAWFEMAKRKWGSGEWEEKAHFYKQRRLFSNIVDELQMGESLENDGKEINTRI